MNASAPTEPQLPPLSDERLNAMERVVFSRIAGEHRRRRTRRTRVWAGVGAAAAIVVVAAVISPAVMSNISLGGAASTVAESAADDPAPMPGEGFAVLPEDSVVPDTGEVGESAPDSASGSAGSITESAPDSDETATGDREFTSQGAATVVVDDVADAAREIEADAEARGGYVESVNVDSADSVAPESGGSSSDFSSDSTIETYPYPAPEGAGRITVRVPAAELRGALDALDKVGEVSSSNLGRQDVTEQAVDLRARVAASEASVARLTQLIAQAESVADLLTAESALAERQAVLDSDRQQLESLQNQVELSTLTVALTPRTAAVVADPASFGDGLAAGWNGLIATLNGIVIALGFLLPWIVVAGVIATIVWGALRAVRRFRSRRTITPGDGE